MDVDQINRSVSKEVMQTGQIKAALAIKYSAPEHAILFEVGNATGFATNRHADAIAMSLWPSRGLSLLGFEIKASRSDWMHELKDPSKAETICAYCDYWYLVIGDPKIVQPGELPATWGLIQPKGDKLVCVKEATKNENAKPVNRGFLAAMFRRIHEQTDRPEKEIRAKSYEEGFKAGKERVDHDQEKWKRPYDELVRSVEEFHAKSGVRISTYQGPHVGSLFNKCFESPKNHEQELWKLLKTADTIRQNIAYAMKNSVHEELCDYII